MFYIWLTIVIALSIVEISTMDLVSVWFIVSGIIAMISSIFTDNLLIQISFFVLLGIMFMILTKDIVKNIAPKKIKTNIDRIIGMEGKVIENITIKNPGTVKVDGKIWTAVANENINKDEYVKILEINSTKLKVEKVKE